MPENERLQQEIDQLKDPAPYQEQFGSPEAADIQQAIDILTKLMPEASSSMTGWVKLKDAIQFLEGEMKKHIEEDK